MNRRSKMKKKRKNLLIHSLITWPGLLSLVPLVVLLLSLLKSGNIHKKMNTINKDAGLIYRLLIDTGFSKKFAQYITAQSAHETANFSSLIYKNNLNAFGMTYQGQKTALGEKDGFAYYDNYLQSVNDYKRLFKSYGFISLGTVENFVSLLKERDYFRAPVAEYLNGLKHFLNLYFPGGELNISLT